MKLGMNFDVLNDKTPVPVFVDGVATCGKYKGETVEWVIRNAPRYITTLYETHELHGLTEGQYDEACEAINEERNGKAWLDD